MRKAQAKKLPLAPDGRFNDKLVTRFINNLMWQGKKSTAINIFYDAVDKVTKMTGEDGYEVWKRAVANVTPAVEVRSRRIGGATFQIPAEVRADRKISLSMKWLIRFSRERNGRTMADKLANEMLAASKRATEVRKQPEKETQGTDTQHTHITTTCIPSPVVAPPHPEEATPRVLPIPRA